MAGYRKDAIFVQLLLCFFSVVSYRGIPDHVDLLQPRNIFDIHWHSRIYIYFSSFLFFLSIYYHILSGFT